MLRRAAAGAPAGAVLDGRGTSPPDIPATPMCPSSLRYGGGGGGGGGDDAGGTSPRPLGPAGEALGGRLRRAMMLSYTLHYGVTLL